MVEEGNEKTCNPVGLFSFLPWLQQWDWHSRIIATSTSRCCPITHGCYRSPCFIWSLLASVTTCQDQLFPSSNAPMSQPVHWFGMDPLDSFLKKNLRTSGCTKKKSFQSLRSSLYSWIPYYWCFRWTSIALWRCFLHFKLWLSDTIFVYMYIIMSFSVFLCNLHHPHSY